MTRTYSQCYEDTENPSCIDLILTSEAKSFQSTCVMETGLSGSHRMTISVLKMHCHKLPPKVISYRDFKNFGNERFMNSLQSAVHNQNGDYVKNPDLFFDICHEILNRHEPRKKNYMHRNNTLFMTKALPKAVMQRACLRNNFLKRPTNQNRLKLYRAKKFLYFTFEKRAKRVFCKPK